MKTRTVLLLGAFIFCGCHSAPPGCYEGPVRDELAAREGPLIPPDELLASLPEDAAVGLALWNNALFNEQLADLGVARGDLIQAGLLPNPDFLYYFPAHLKPYKYYFELPLEALWLRPIRVKAARWEWQRVEKRLVQSGLDLIRDVRVAYVDLWLARARLDVALEAVRIRGQIAELARKRLEAGDATPQETATSQVEKFVADQDTTRIGYDVRLAEQRLIWLLGFPPQAKCVIPTAELDAPSCPLDACALEEEAVHNRPDLQAAAEAVEAARKRLCLTRLVWFRLVFRGDATSGEGSHVFSPAFLFTVPIFNRNEGNIARAEAELARAERNCNTVRNQIILDVRSAVLRYAQARSELQIVEQKVLPEVRTAIGRAETAYREGNTSLLLALEASRQLLDGLLRRAQLKAEMRRAWAELERGVGKRLAPPGAGTHATDEKAPREEHQP